VSARPKPRQRPWTEIDRPAWWRRRIASILGEHSIAEVNELELDPKNDPQQLKRERGDAGGGWMRTLNVWGCAPLRPAALVWMGRYGPPPTVISASAGACVAGEAYWRIGMYTRLAQSHAAGALWPLHLLDVRTDYLPHGCQAQRHRLLRKRNVGQLAVHDSLVVDCLWRLTSRASYGRVSH
jgi:hypothetical protein